MKWLFPVCDTGEIEGLGNGNLEMFRGDPLKSLAREICQNSLDACNDSSIPVRVEFQLHDVSISEFPGMMEMRDIISKCEKFWKDDTNAKTLHFIEKATDVLSQGKLKVLRISDYNTKGLCGAFDENNFRTAWTGLVKSTAVSIKNDAGAAGSYGIGKNAPFVNSYLQTVFYRTLDIEDVKAACGVARLMTFEDEFRRRSVGYFSDDIKKPVSEMSMLNRIFERCEYGTDLFIPGFKIEDKWIDKMVGEIIENFLMSIYRGRLEVKIGNVLINSETLNQIIARYKKYIKDGDYFNKVLLANPEPYYEDFHGMGRLCLRILYKKDQNQKILVVRNTGMKIAEIPKLPKTISFSGILELEGKSINEFFREMETPQHNKWEPKRHPTDPEGAREKLEELENWVRRIINEKVSESIGASMDLDTLEYFTGGSDSKSEDGAETMVDSSLEATFKPHKKSTKHYSSSGNSGGEQASGFVDEDGEETGHRHRTGTNGGNATGRPATINPLGPDTVYVGRKKVAFRARVVKESKEVNRIILSTTEPINQATVEIVTMGENGKSLPLHVAEVVDSSVIAYCKNGKIYVDAIEAGEKAVISFKLGVEYSFALGVKVYGNKQ